MNKNLFSIVIIITGILFSCTAVEEPLIDNPYDPEYVSSTDPMASISSGISEGDELDVTMASFSWSGEGGNSSEFAYMLEGRDTKFSEWSNTKTINYDYLDEGDYTFLVKERYANQVEQESPTSRSFTVNAVKGFALIFEKYFTDAPSGSNFSIDVNVEQAKLLTGFKTIIKYNSSEVTFKSVEEKTGIENIDNVAVFERELSPGNLELNVLLLGTDGGFIGDASVCTINFTSKTSSQSQISFVEDSTIMRNANNTNITINTFRSATINE